MKRFVRHFLMFLGLVVLIVALPPVWARLTVAVAAFMFAIFMYGHRLGLRAIREFEGNSEWTRSLRYSIPVGLTAYFLWNFLTGMLFISGFIHWKNEYSRIAVIQRDDYEVHAFLDHFLHEFIVVDFETAKSDWSYQTPDVNPQTFCLQELGDGPLLVFGIDGQVHWAYSTRIATAFVSSDFVYRFPTTHLPLSRISIDATKLIWKPVVVDD